jgi:voltage-gated potassium channel
VPPTAADLTGHYIICGYGRVGREVAAALHRRKHSVVAIDRESTAFAGSPCTHTIKGDASDDAALIDAGIARARGLVAGTGSDATNLAIVLSAHALNPELLIVARANQPEAEAKLMRAGAGRVVSPYAIGAHRMATQLVSPGIAAFLDAIRDTEQIDLWIEEAVVGAGSAIVGQRVGDALPRASGLPNLIALRRGPHGSVASPSPDLRLAPGDTLIVVGSRAQLQDLLARATARAAAPAAGR